MSNKLGRPTDNLKNNLLQIRIDNDTLNKLDSLVKENNSNRSEIVRKGINIQYDKIKK